MLTTVEKVLFLQDMDIFEYTATEGLAHLAAITEELTLPAGEVIFREGDLPDAMFVVIDGQVKMTRNGQEVMVAGSKEVFGTWALFDEEPRVVTATTIDECRVLKIDKEDFIDLLADNVRITQSVLKTMVIRLRSLMTRVGR
ncbi:MAG: cyclic nucleotide-binding domain-containing protein [bacterium]|nr:MAG: cyclic nucleotide-binding domain-containing protein [bacterium]